MNECAIGLGIIILLGVINIWIAVCASHLRNIASTLEEIRKAEK